MAYEFFDPLNEQTQATQQVDPFLKRLEYAQNKGWQAPGQLLQAISSPLVSLFHPEVAKQAALEKEQATPSQYPTLAQYEAMKNAPQFRGERTLQELVSKMPTAAIGGLPALEGMLWGQGAKEGVRGLGGSEGLQTGADILGSLYGGIKGAAREKGLPTTTRAAKEQAFKILEQPHVGQGEVAMEPAFDAIRAVRDKMQTTGVADDAGILKQIGKGLDGIVTKLKTAPLKKLVEFRQQIDALYDGIKSTDAKKVVQNLRDEINNLIRGDWAKAVDPVFWENQQIGDRLTWAEKAKSSLNYLAKEMWPSWKDAMINKKWAAVKGAGAGFIKGTATVSDIVKYMKLPQFRQIYTNLLSATNPNEYARFSTQLMDLLAEREGKPVGRYEFFDVID